MFYQVVLGSGALFRHCRLNPRLASMTGSQSDKRDETSRDDLRYLDTRPYLDRTVVPILMQALTVIAKER